MSGYIGAGMFVSTFEAKTHPWTFQLFRDAEKSNYKPAEILDTSQVWHNDATCPEPDGPSLFLDVNYKSNKIQGLLETLLT